jgi:hypothetical protein
VSRNICSNTINYRKLELFFGVFFFFLNGRIWQNNNFTNPGLYGTHVLESKSTMLMVFFLQWRLNLLICPAKSNLYGELQKTLFVTRCTVVGGQRINANEFLTPYDLFSLSKTQCQNQFSNHNYIIPSLLFRKPLTLFAPTLLHHVRLVCSSSSLPMLSLPSQSTDCLSFPPPGGPGPLRPPPPSWPNFLQVPGNSLLLCQAQTCLFPMKSPDSVNKIIIN